MELNVEYNLQNFRTYTEEEIDEEMYRSLPYDLKFSRTS